MGDLLRPTGETSLPPLSVGRSDFCGENVYYPAGFSLDSYSALGVINDYLGRKEN